MDTVTCLCTLHQNMYTGTISCLDLLNQWIQHQEPPDSFGRPISILLLLFLDRCCFLCQYLGASSIGSPYDLVMLEMQYCCTSSTSSTCLIKHNTITNNVGQINDQRNYSRVSLLNFIHGSWRFTHIRRSMESKGNPQSDMTRRRCWTRARSTAGSSTRS